MAFILLLLWQTGLRLVIQDERQQQVPVRLRSSAAADDLCSEQALDSACPVIALRSWGPKSPQRRRPVAGDPDHARRSDDMSWCWVNVWARLYALIAAERILVLRLERGGIEGRRGRVSWRLLDRCSGIGRRPVHAVRIAWE